MVKIPAIPAARLIEAVQGTILTGDPQSIEVLSIAEPSEAAEDSVSFVISEAFLKAAAASKARVLIVNASLAEKIAQSGIGAAALVVSSPDAYLGLAKVSEIIAKVDPHADWRLPGAATIGAGKESATPFPLIHPSAKVDPSVKVGANASIDEGAVIGARSVILHNAVVGPGVEIGEDCVVFPGVVLYPRVKLGNRVRIHANTVLGSDGFGYARGPQGSVKIWHLGRVVVQDDVEIGAGTMIDKGTIKDTIVERGVKIDNLVQIGHNGHIKAHAVLCGQVGLAGNVTVGRGAIMAGKASAGDKVEIGDGAIVGPDTGATKDVKAGETIVAVLPGRPRREWWRFLASLDRVSDLLDRVKKLEGKK